MQQPIPITSGNGLAQQIAAKIAEISRVEDDIPAMIIIHDIRDSTVLYMSRRGLFFLGVGLEELQQMGTDYHARFFNMDFADIYVPKIFGLMERNNDDEVISFFQQVRSSPDKDWTWFLSCTKIFMRDHDGNPLLIITNAVPLDADHYIEAAKAQRLLAENNFLRNNYQVFDQLTRREKEILTMMALGNSSGKMANKLSISETTVSTHRRNIKRKLKVESNYDITRFAQAFDLI